jgi:hypothetical protein
MLLLASNDGGWHLRGEAVMAMAEAKHDIVIFPVLGSSARFGGVNSSA